MGKSQVEHSTTIKAKKRKVVDSERVEPVSEGGNVRRIEFEGREPVRERTVTRTEREWRPRHAASIEDIHFEVDQLGRRRRAAPKPRPRREHDIHPVHVDKAIVTRESRKAAAATKKSRRKAREAPEAKPEEPQYQPQCGAITSAAKQCRNSAKAGSKYCGAHQGYTQARGAKVLDTKPRAGTEDTKPGQKGSMATSQCAAYTKDGVQCKHVSRKRSKYCGIHKNYRAPSKGQLATRLDTKPRHAKAEDTKPST